MVYATLDGRGNVALWPEPALDWPFGLRAYPQEIAVDLNSEGGLVGGSKTFAYMVVADSAGTHRVPAPRYTYFDVGDGRYVELRAAPIEFVTPSRRAGLAPVQTVRPLVAATAYSAEGLVAGVPLWGWILVLVLPPLILLAMRVEVRVPRRAPRRPKAAQDAGSGARLKALETEFRGVLEELVPAARHKATEGLAAALRAAGVEASLAAHAARVRDRLRQALYGPEGSTDPEELTAEVHEVLRALIGGTGRVRSTSVAVLVLVLLCGAAGAAGAQSAERLYDAGAVRSAADSFAYRAAQDPLTAAHWYNLGAALNRLGESVRARAAWLRAARLAPRDETITRALAGTTPPGASPRGFTWISPVTAAEAFLIAAAFWMFAWFLLTARVRLRHVVPFLLVAVLAAAYGNSVTRRYARPLALVMLDETPLRAAPFGSAEPARELGRGVAVLIEEERGPWVLATDGVRRGWLLRTEVVQP
jgi:tetratricopeptide (TPR) repeat protein